MKWIMRPYYLIWADALHWEINVRSRQNREIYLPLAAISVAQFFNIVALTILLDWSGNCEHLVEKILQSEWLHAPLSWIAVFLPFIIFNYVLIYRNNRYRRLMADLPAFDGKLYLFYFYGSVACLLIPSLLKF